MKILATLPAKGRDLRLDLFRGVANWGIFLDHIPNNIVNWVTTRNYGFSDAADLFIFISGYTVAFVFARIMLERGFIVGASRLLKRVWQIYVAHVFLFVLYLAEIGYLAQRYGNSGFTDEFNIRGFLANPAQFLFEGLILRFKPVNMDVLPLYIVLMGVFPPILWLMLRRPNSHDKSLPIGIAFGSRVFVCDNLAFSADHVISASKETPLSDQLADHAILDLYRKEVIGVQAIGHVLKAFEEPPHDWGDRTAWRLFNAATYALAGKVAEKPDLTKQLHQVIDGVCERLH
jgi:hypothetical protein